MVRYMPQAVACNPNNPDGAMVQSPSVSADRWLAGVKALVGREMTDAELRRCETLAAHNWSIRVAAEDILGRDLTHEEVEARRNW